MYICYIDESGDSGTLTQGSAADSCSPFFIISGLIIDQQCLSNVTYDLIEAKKRFFPNKLPPVLSKKGTVKSSPEHLDWILTEIKGCDLRRSIRKGKVKEKQTAIGFIDNCLKILEKHDVKLVGNALIKKVGNVNSDAIFYGHSVLKIASKFELFLEEHYTSGLLIADSRKTSENERTTHSLFTQKHSGTKLRKINEVVTYGHSTNFAMLQLADIVCSAVLFPMFCYSFARSIPDISLDNININEGYGEIARRYSEKIKHLQMLTKIVNREGEIQKIWGLSAVNNNGEDEQAPSFLLFDRIQKSLSYFFYRVQNSRS